MSLSSYEIPLGVWPLSYALHKDTLCLFRSQIVFGCQEKPETNGKGAREYRFGGERCIFPPL